jgi:AmmeMemoRadiSam system protein A
MEDRLNDEERLMLLRLAREAIIQALKDRKLKPIDLSQLPARLQELGATFVTLTKDGMLRGCIGALEPYLPLAEDVREHAVAAALEDYRFPPVQATEVDQVRIEISRLTLPERLAYKNPTDLLEKLRPGVDGVILRDGYHRATFLPQVWEKVPDKIGFLEHLCQKMGAHPDTWRRKHLDVLIYQVEEFHE